MEPVKQRVAELAEQGVFGPGKFVQVNNTLDDEKGEQFMSQLFFLCVEMETDEKQEIPIVVKIQVPEQNRDAGTYIQFTNEVNFYSKVLIELGPIGLKMCPKMYYGLATAGEDAEKDIVVLEDIRASSGFKLSKELFLDYDHTVLTMKKLGEFHGLSYKLKKSSPDKVQHLAKELNSDVIFDYDNGMMDGAMLRGFKPLMQEYPDDDILRNAYKKMSAGSQTQQWVTTRKPEEPFAVIAHGDFNKNNLMYGYDVNGKVNDIKLFDFGTAVYSDPAIDIAFFLYINTTADSRQKHWDDYLKSYWEGVISVEKEPGFSFNQFLQQFAKRAVWGYFPCCFYLPMLMFADEMPEDFQQITYDERRDLCMNWGGEVGEKAVVDIVRHLHMRGYLEEYVKHFNC